MSGQECDHIRCPVQVLPTGRGDHLVLYDAVSVGGALYCVRWNKAGRRHGKGDKAAIAAQPEWGCSSGPFSTMPGFAHSTLAAEWLMGISFTEPSGHSRLMTAR